MDDKETSVSEAKHEEVQGIGHESISTDWASVSKIEHVEIQEIEGESTSTYMVEDSESQSAQTHVDDSCRIPN